MLTYVSDFGVTKLSDHKDSITYTKTLATMGYAHQVKFIRQIFKKYIEFHDKSTVDFFSSFLILTMDLMKCDSFLSKNMDQKD